MVLPRLRLIADFGRSRAESLKTKLLCNARKQLLYLLNPRQANVSAFGQLTALGPPFVMAVPTSLPCGGPVTSHDNKPPRGAFNVFSFIPRTQKSICSSLRSE